MESVITDVVNQLSTDDVNAAKITAARTTSFLRKSNKPLMEKRRRERINNCLEQLKAILMDVTKKESSYYSKLEKADILEMTVKYLDSLRRHRIAASKKLGDRDTDEMCRYIAGYNECASVVTQYLTTLHTVSDDARCCLLNHLANSLQQTVSSTHSTNQVTSSSTTPLPTIYVINQNVTSSTDAVPSLTNVDDELRVLPARLTTNGPIVLLLTNSSNPIGSRLSSTSTPSPDVHEPTTDVDSHELEPETLRPGMTPSGDESRPLNDVTADDKQAVSETDDVNNNVVILNDLRMWRPW